MLNVKIFLFLFLFSTLYDFHTSQYLSLVFHKYLSRLPLRGYTSLLSTVEAWCFQWEEYVSPPS